MPRDTDPLAIMLRRIQDAETRAEVAEARAAQTANENALLRRALEEAQALQRKFARRVMPDENDLRDHGVTPAKCVRWLDANMVRRSVDPGSVVSVYPSWHAPDDESDTFVGVYLERESVPYPGAAEREVAQVIEWASEALGCDQWHVLAEMAESDPPRPVTSTVIAETDHYTVTEHQTAPETVEFAGYSFTTQPLPTFTVTSNVPSQPFGGDDDGE